LELTSFLLIRTGVEAMLEQGFAQSRAWLLRSAASPWGGKRAELGVEIEEAARARVRGMDDIKADSK
jgi:hypothetical protein